MGLREVLYDSLLNEEDSFACKCRKLMAVMSASALLVPLVTIPYLAAASAAGDSPIDQPTGTGVAIAIVGLVVMLCFTFIPTYFYVRCTGNAPEWIFDLLIIISNLALLPVTIGIFRFPTQPNLILFGLWTVFSGTPRLYTHICLLSIHYLVAGYNEASQREEFMLQLNNAYLGHPWGLILQQLTSFINIGCAIFIALVMYRQLVSAVLAAHTAIELSHIVADQLVHYDTEAVRKTLEKYDEVCEDKDLIQCFFKMAENLDEYRPYLPNWLLFKNKRSVTGGTILPDDEDEDAEGCEEEEDDERTISQSSAGTKRTRDDATSIRLEVDKSGGEDAASDRRSVMTDDNKSRASRASLYQKAPVRRKTGGLRPTQPIDGQSVRSRGARSGYGGAGAGAGALHGAAVPMNAAQAMLTRTRQSQADQKVTVALFQFGVAKGANLDRSQKTAALGKFIERCGDAAATTNGAIHSFACNKLILSWGAYPQPRPETKAAQFINLMTRDCGDPNIQFYGAAVTGKTEVQIAGGRRQQALLVSTPWYRDVVDSAALAARHKALVIDNKTRGVAHDQWITRIFDVLLSPVLGKTGEVSQTASAQGEGSQPGSKQQQQQQLVGGLDIPGLQQFDANTLENAHIDGRSYKQILLHTVIKERPQEHDEWLYELDKKKTKSAEDAVTEAVVYCIQSQYRSGIRLFEEINDSTVMGDEHVKRLVDRAKLFAALGSKDDGKSHYAQRLTIGI